MAKVSKNGAMPNQMFKGLEMRATLTLAINMLPYLKQGQITDSGQGGMPSGNSPDVSIFVTGESITKEVEINRIRVVEHGPIPGNEYISRIANSGTHQLLEEFVRGPTNR